MCMQGVPKAMVSHSRIKTSEAPRLGNRLSEQQRHDAAIEIEWGRRWVSTCPHHTKSVHDLHSTYAREARKSVHPATVSLCLCASASVREGKCQAPSLSVGLPPRAPARRTVIRRCCRPLGKQRLPDGSPLFLDSGRVTTRQCARAKTGRMEAERGAATRVFLSTPRAQVEIPDSSTRITNDTRLRPERIRAPGTNSRAPYRNVGCPKITQERKRGSSSMSPVESQATLSTMCCPHHLGVSRY